MDYLRRSIARLAAARLKTEKVLALTGARQTGKTTLCQRILPELLGQPFTYISFDDPDERLRFRDSAVAILEAIRTPLVVLDEVQKIPALFDPLKLVADRADRANRQNRQDNVAGQGAKRFIITGSSQLLLMGRIRESLAGRAALLNLYPFSLAEVSRCHEASPLSAIWRQGRFDNDVAVRFHELSADSVRTAISLRDEHLQWGGYPPVWQRPEGIDKTNWLKDYRKTYIERDILDVGQVSGVESFILAQKLLCARTGQILSLSEVARDVSLSVNTVKRYVNLLVMSFQCHLLQPYYENVGKRFIKSPKIYFPDPGLSRSILGDMSVNAGALYESWVFSELTKWRQTEPVEPELFFYRTSAGMEIDFLIAEEGKILPVEVKASNKAAHADAANIEAFMNEHRTIAPVGLIVYRGKELVEVRRNIWAVPDWYLFGAALSAQ